MPVSEVVKPSHEAWSDWLPSHFPTLGPELPRSELLKRLRQQGVDVSDRLIRYWEVEGILPRPSRRWDATAKTSKVFYPAFALAPIAALYELSRDGYKLGELGPALRAAAFAGFHVLVEYRKKRVGHGEVLLPPDDVDLNAHEAAQRDQMMIGAGLWTAANTLYEDEVRPMLERYGRLVSRSSAANAPDGTPAITHITLGYIDAKKHEITGHVVDLWKRRD